MANTFGKAKKTRSKSDNTNKHRKSVENIVDYVIENSDIILEVLDARFIEQTRQKEIEEKIKMLGKKLIFVLNKSDLVDSNKIYRETELEKLKPGVTFSAKVRKGVFNLKRLIKKEAKKIKKDDINIGVIGYPNAGKSSLINLLAGKASAKVSSESGYTKSFQKIRLSEGLYLIDTPGIISEEDRSALPENKARQARIGAISWDKIRDPEMAVTRIMKDYPGVLEYHYKIDEQGDPETLIENLGRRLNYLKKGNKVDEMRTTKQILKDWQGGKIKQK